MKKTLVLAGITAFLLSSTVSIAATVNQPENTCPVKKECPKKKEFKGEHKGEHKGPNIDERLKLTEEQKVEAKAIRMKGHEKMKPVFEKIKAKKQEAEAVKMSRIAVQAQEEKLAVIKNEIKTLKQEARKIREENTKEFEAILTPEQKIEFEKIKAEGRERFKNKHKSPNKPCPMNTEKEKPLMKK